MYHKYKSDYPNQVHQLNFYISQNHHLLKSGEIKYQVKKFDVNWTNYSKTGKRHLASYLVRDHFSNCFYAEIYPIDEVPHISTFLFNAWRPKENFEFCGIPRNLILGRHIVEKFPDLENLLTSIGLNIELAQNGFATGIRSVKDWENCIRYYSIFENYKHVQCFQDNIELICRDINLRETGKSEQNLLKWMNNEPRGKLINSISEFENHFNTSAK